MNLDLAKDLYFRELDERLKLDGAVGMRVGILTVVGGVLAYVVQHLWPFRSPLAMTGLVLWSGAVGCYLVAVAFVLLAATRATYARLAPPDRLLEYHKELQAYFEENPAVTGSASEDFDGHVIRTMCVAAAIDANQNMRRSGFLYRANVSLALAVILTIASGLTLLICHVA